MSTRKPAHRADPEMPTGRVRAYLRRFFTSWVADDPDPSYSALDRSDGLGQVPDPICQPRAQLAESCEVSRHVSGGGDETRSGADQTLPGADQARRAVGGRVGL